MKTVPVNVVTGEVLKVGDCLKRINRNAKGNRPSAIISGFFPSDGLINLIFQDGNERATTAALYGVQYIPEEEL